MKFTAVVENGFAKFEVHDCNFKKAVTIAKHLRNYVFEKSGIRLEDFVDVDTYSLEGLRKWNKYGEIHTQDYWEADWSEEGRGNDCPKYLAYVIDIEDDCDGGFNYAYFGVNVNQSGYKVKKGFTPDPYEHEEEE